MSDKEFILKLLGFVFPFAAVIIIALLVFTFFMRWRKIQNCYEVLVDFERTLSNMSRCPDISKQYIYELSQVLRVLKKYIE